jgi:D-threo-aldose 1-dehydrogenase
VTRPVLPRLGLGCAPLGNLFSAVSNSDAAATVDAAWELGIRFFDTAPLYGHGLSEQRLGAALAGRPRDSYVLATKVGRLLRNRTGEAPPTIFIDVPDLVPTFAYTRDAVLRSIEESLVRLGVDRIDVVHVHDPDDHEADALNEAFPTLIELRDQGVIGAVGCGMNQSEMLDRLVQQVDLDVVLLAGRFTLLDRTGAEELLPRCVERGVDVILGGVFNSGLLVDPDRNQTYDYAAAPPQLVVRAKAMADACRNYGVSLAAAAIQFGLRHEAVSSVVVGARTAAEIQADIDDSQVAVPEALWDELKSL